MSAIGSMIGILGSLATLYDRIEGRKPGTTVSDVLGNYNLDEASVKLAASDGNMVNFLNPFIVEPTIFVSRNANNRNDISSIIEHTVDVYAAFYVQAFKVLNNIHDLSTTETLNILSTKRFDMESITDLSMMDLESFKSLPNINKDRDMDIEAVSSELTKTVNTAKEDGVLGSKTIIRQIEIIMKSDMKARKNDEVVVDNKLTTTLTIVIKANVNVVDLDTISNSVEHRSSNSGFFKRILQWKVGIISTRDLLLAGDLIDSYKKGALTKENFGAALDKSASNHINIQSIVDKRLGLNKVVFSYIITDDELELLGKRMGYNISKGSDKTDMMNALLALNITSINEDRELVSVYINGISGMTPTPIKKLSKSGTKDGGDAIEMLATAMMSNKSVF